MPHGRYLPTLLSPLLIFTSHACADFEFEDFSDNSELNLAGSAFVEPDGVLSLTTSVARSAGAAWFHDKQRVAQGFETTFVFGAKDVQGFGADGVAFVIQNADEMALGGTGGAMGYGNNRFFNEVGIANSFAVELDLWDNSREGDWPDLDDAHISLQTNGLLPNDPSEAFSLGVAPITEDVEDQQPHVVKIVYSPQGVFSVFIDDLVTPQLMVPNIDLSSILSLDDGRAWVGLTGATGRASDVQTHLIFAWEFIEPVPAPSVALTLAFGAMGWSTRRRRV